MDRNTVILIGFLTALAGNPACAACGDEQPMPDASVDAGSDVPTDADDQTDDGIDMHSDLGPRIDRQLTTLPVLDGLPFDNRILSPQFEPVQWFAVSTETSTTIRRQVYTETPYPAATARLLGEGQPVDLSLYGQAGDGSHTASVWLGTDGDAAPVDASASLHGVTIGDLDGEPTPVSLAPTDEVLRSNSRVWVRFDARFDAFTGPFLLIVEDDGSRDLLVHAPIVRSE